MSVGDEYLVHGEDGVTLLLHFGAGHLGTKLGAEDLRFPHLHLRFDLLDVLAQRVLEPLHELRVLGVLGTLGRTRHQIGARELLDGEDQHHLVGSHAWLGTEERIG
jgi:hypothetical protein